MKKRTIPVRRSSGNVFADLGFPDADTALMKAKIVTLIGNLIREQRLTQIAAAQKMGLKQPDVSRLLDGQTDGFSLERLLGLLLALGQRVTVECEPANQNAAPGNPRLVFAHV
jgi:predicted XRE-type DNA-binding protein